MRRLLAALLMSAGLIVGSLTLSGWWIRQTILDPARTERVADAILQNPSVRRELAKRMVEGVAATLPPQATGPLSTFRTQIQDALESPALTDPLTVALVDVHRRLVGLSTGPVVLSPAVVTSVIQQAVPTIDPALLATIPAVSFEVPEAKPLSTARERLPDVLGTGALVALGLVAAAFVVHPRRAILLTRLGWWMIGISALQVFFLYLVPVVVAPALVNNVWTGLVSEVAVASASGVIGVLIALGRGRRRLHPHRLVVAHQWGRPPPSSVGLARTCSRPGLPAGPDADLLPRRPARRFVGPQRRRHGLAALSAPTRATRFGAGEVLCHACHVLVAVAQLVRAPGCGPGGRGFKSPRSPHRLGSAASLLRL